MFASSAKGAACFINKTSRSIKKDIVQNLASFFCTEERVNKIF